MKASEDLLTRDLVHIVASDGHAPQRRPPRLDEAFEEIRRRYGEDVARALLIDNPTAVIRDRELPYRPEAEAQKRAKRRWAFLHK
jgi:protein-tyrosine phosphatase